MKAFVGLVAAAISCGVGMGSASAAWIKLDAAPVSGPFGDFSIKFDDAGDGLLDLSEVLTFSGVLDADRHATLTVLGGVPDIPGISRSSGLLGPIYWGFGGPGLNSTFVPSDYFTYRLTAAETAVPEPAALSLALAGLSILGLSRIRRRLVPNQSPV